MPRLRIGTRQSALALAQSQWVIDQLVANSPGLEVERILITTSGDTRSADLREKSINIPGGLKALFTKEIEDALQEGRIDLAVHSLKDMAAELPSGLALGAFPKREDARDVWISKDGTPFAELGRGARVATGAVRRQAQLRHLRPDLIIVPMRGNVDTRLRKLQEGKVDGIVLAAAGLLRLGRQAEVTEYLESESFLPAPGQGCLALEVRKSDTWLQPYLASIDHAPTRQAVTAERACLRVLGGSCNTPIGAYAYREGSLLRLVGLVLSPEGDRTVRRERTGGSKQPQELGESVANALLAGGARTLLQGPVF